MMVETATLEQNNAVSKDPNAVPHMLRALDQYLMQDTEQQLSKVILEAAESVGVDPASLSNEALTAYLQEHADRW